jgi:hypothetical protein
MSNVDARKSSTQCGFHGNEPAREFADNLDRYPPYQRTKAATVPAVTWQTAWKRPRSQLSQLSFHFIEGNRLLQLASGIQDSDLSRSTTGAASYVIECLIFGLEQWLRPGSSNSFTAMGLSRRILA